MRLKNFYVGLLAVAVSATSAVAGPVYLQLVADPATTAGSGIPAVSGMNVSSTQSGANRWHLYAIDTNVGSLGIAQYNISLNDTSTILHRSPVTTIQDPDTEATFSAGFSVFRNQLAGAGGFIQASQSVPVATNPYASIDGFGRTTGNFVAEANAVNPNHTVIGPTTSGQWGNYATDPAAPADGAGLNWLLLAEGQYTGTTVPTIGLSQVVLFYDGSFASPAASQVVVLSGDVPNTIPTVNSVVFPGYNANLPGDPQTLVHQFTATDTEDPAGPFTWDGLSLLSYTENYGGEGPGPLTGANLSGSGGFSWISEGSPRGDYVWQVRATDPDGGQGLGTITVNVTGVPEPTTLTLFGLAMVGAMGLVRRRNS